MSTTATMMWGHVETLEERVEHLRVIRDLQDEMHGFRAFISWTYQPDNTELAPQVTWNPTSFDYLLMQAVTRIYLDNVEHIQSSWVTQGTKIGQVALGFGADDMSAASAASRCSSASARLSSASSDARIGSCIVPIPSSSCRVGLTGPIGTASRGWTPPFRLRRITPIRWSRHPPDCRDRTRSWLGAPRRRADRCARG